MAKNNHPNRSKKDRRAAYDDRANEAGIAKVCVRIPEHRREKLLAICDKWRSEERLRGVTVNN